MDVPQEIRLRILQFTDLVLRPNPTHEYPSDSLMFENGKEINSQRKPCSPGCPSLKCSCYVFPAALFYTSRQLSLEAREVYLSSNRLVFLDDPNLAVERFLGKQPDDLLRKIREIEFSFGPDELDYFRDPTSKYVKAWNAFVSFAAAHLNLGNLVFSIDAGSAYEQWAIEPISAESLSFLLPVYDEIVAPMKKLKGLKRLFVYWPVFHMREIIAEKEVMGDDYDSSKFGKTPVAHRQPMHPRGHPTNPSIEGYMGNFGEL